MRLPIYAHSDASVPSKWVELPDFLANGWTGDPPKDGGYLVPNALASQMQTNLLRRGFIAPPMLYTQRRALAAMPRWWRPVHRLLWALYWPVADIPALRRAWGWYRGKWPN